ncbi:unnamed protein product [Mesocestoides corti]|uniref:1-acylglycerol-3-phosphate O-acyltransferase n=1 Tax=Mesocestoides corti TaxID=53468 RepID=A0A158QUN9_MESCO|nr:unnamed protein product [Mesocestoides corti]
MYWKVILGLVLFAMIFRGVRLRLRYFLAFFIYAVVVMFGSVVYTIKFALKGKPRYENSWEFTEVYRLARSLIGLQPRIYGLETYDPEKQCVYITNHQSFIDVLCNFDRALPYNPARCSVPWCVALDFYNVILFALALLDIWNQRCTVIAKNSLKYFGPLGAILYYTKTILIHRSDHKKAIDEMNRTAELIVKDEVNLFMFPEGTRNASGRLLPFKKGAFYLAIQTQLPIQPIVVSCYNSFLDHKKCTFSPVPFGVYILPAIPTTGMEVSQVNELVDQAYASMSEIYERTVKASREELGNDLRKKSECHENIFDSGPGKVSFIEPRRGTLPHLKLEFYLNILISTMDVLWLLIPVSLVTGFYIVYKIPVVRYYMKYVIFGIILNLGSVFYTIVFLVRGKPSFSNSSEALPLLRISQWALGLRPKIYGLENCYKFRQCVYVVNHQSFIDAVEGTRNSSGQLLPFKKGAFHLAIQAQIPVVAIVISCYNSFLDHKNKVFEDVAGKNVCATNDTTNPPPPSYTAVSHLAAYGVYVLPPIPTEGLTSADAGNLLEQSYAAMKEIFDITATATKDELGLDLRENLRQEH